MRRKRVVWRTTRSDLPVRSGTYRDRWKIAFCKVLGCKIALCKSPWQFVPVFSRQKPFVLAWKGLRAAFGTLLADEVDIMSHYKTPEALRHDARTVAEDARALMEATAEFTDEKVAKARKRLADALEQGRGIYAGLQEKAVDGAKAVDECVREHPYQSIAIAFGVGALLGVLLSRRN